jgi:hypothetical protein
LKNAFHSLSFRDWTGDVPIYVVGLQFPNDPEHAPEFFGQDVGVVEQNQQSSQHQCCSSPDNFSGWYKWLLSYNKHHQHTESKSNDPDNGDNTYLQ